MYEAKDAGRDRTIVYRAAHDSSSRLDGRVSWPDIIRDGLDEDRFVLQAQPIMNLATGDIEPVRAAAAAARPVRRADLPRRLPPRRRALRPDRRDRPLGRLALDRDAGRGEPPRPPAHLRGQHLRPQRRRPGPAGADRGRAAHARGRPGAGDLRDHRDDGGRQHPARAGVRAPAGRARLPLRARRLRRRLRLVLLPQAPPVRLPEDRRRVRARLRGRPHRPARDPGGRRHRHAGSASARSPRWSATRRRCDLVRELGVDYVQGFHLGRPAPLARWLVDTKPAADRRRHPVIVPAR